MMGRIHIVTNRVGQGIAERCQRALALDRNLADAQAVIGLAKIFSGHPDETETRVNEAFRLSARPPSLSLDTICRHRRDSIWAAMRRPLRVRGAGPLKSIAIIQWRNSTSRQPSHTLGQKLRRSAIRRPGLALQPIRASPISVFRAAVGSDSTTFLAQRAPAKGQCAWLACRKNERKTEGSRRSWSPTLSVTSRTRRVWTKTFCARAAQGLRW